MKLSAMPHANERKIWRGSECLKLTEGEYSNLKRLISILMARRLTEDIVHLEATISEEFTKQFAKLCIVRLLFESQRFAILDVAHKFI
jgi:hypothetical protein